eukprot:9239347-Pyramimonas_sp.AAC.2
MGLDYLDDFLFRLQNPFRDHVEPAKGVAHTLRESRRSERIAPESDVKVQSCGLTQVHPGCRSASSCHSRGKAYWAGATGFAAGPRVIRTTREREATGHSDYERAAFPFGTNDERSIIVDAERVRQRTISGGSGYDPTHHGTA